MAYESLGEDRWSIARESLGAGSSTLLFGTSTRSLDRWARRLAAATKTSVVAAPDADGKQEHENVEAVLLAAHPGRGSDPATWARWEDLLPHILSTDLANTNNPDLRALAVDVVTYLTERREYLRARSIGQALYEFWLRRLGESDQSVLSMAAALAAVHRGLGLFENALQIDQKVLARRRGAFGEDNADTLTSANNLARDLYELGEFEQARLLDEDTLARRRRLQGEDHLELSPSDQEALEQLVRTQVDIQGGRTGTTSVDVLTVLTGSAIAARLYEEIRLSPSRPSRTGDMEGVMGIAGSAAVSGSWSKGEVTSTFLIGTEGTRIFALGLMEGDYRLADFECVLNAITHSHSAFEQNHALRIAGKLLPTLSPADLLKLKDALTDQMGSEGHVHQGSRRWHIAQDLLRRIADDR